MRIRFLHGAGRLGTQVNFRKKSRAGDVRGLAQRFVQVATVAFWLPCISIDFYVLWRGGYRPYALSTVFWALFRESLAFLTLWAIMGFVQALVAGGAVRELPTKPKRPSRRRVPVSATFMPPARDHRGQ